jgi:hypothetical protein
MNILCDLDRVVARTQNDFSQQKTLVAGTPPKMLCSTQLSQIKTLKTYLQIISVKQPASWLGGQSF